MPKSASAQTADLEPLLRRFSTDRADVERFWSLPFSESARQRRAALLDQTRAALVALDYSRLGPDARVDWHLLSGFVEHERAQQALERRREAEIAALVPFAGRIVAWEEARVRVEALDPEKTAEGLASLLREIRAAREQKREGLPPVHAQRAARAVNELNGILARWFGHYDGFHPLFGWWCRAPYGEVKAALEDYEKHLREELAGVKGKDDDPLIGDPIGRDALKADLAFERINATPEQLVATAERELAWCEGELKRASREMGLGDDWKAALEKVKAQHVPPGEQDALVARQAREAIAFVDARELVTVEPLCRETWRVDMLDRDGQKVLPFAAYGGQKMLVAYPLESMDFATKTMSLRGNNIAFSHIVTPHELIPGHHLQLYMADRYRAYRRPFQTPFLVEGWALHWEMLLWDLGYATTPQERIGMLFWRMHRCARIIVSLGFHLGTMTPSQMIDFLVEKVGHERFTATSEVRRFVGDSYSPLYQCAYMVGGLQLRALYQERTGKAGWSLKRFHDAVLHEGPIPIDLIAARLTGRTLEREAVPASLP